MMKSEMVLRSFMAWAAAQEGMPDGVVTMTALEFTFASRADFNRAIDWLFVPATAKAAVKADTSRVEAQADRYSIRLVCGEQGDAV